MTIRAIIKKSGKSHAAIAEEVGVSRGLISLIATGQRPISADADMLLKFSKALNVEPKDLRPDLASLFLPSSDDLCEADKSSCLGNNNNNSAPIVQEGET